MNAFRNLAAVAAITWLAAVPAQAVDLNSVTFAQFTQQGTDKIAQYANTGIGNTLQIAESPAFFTVNAYGVPGSYPSVMEMQAASSALITSVGPQFEQAGWAGFIKFGDGANFLTANFANATFSFDANGGSASLISTDPADTILYSSNFLNLPGFDFRNFALAFTGLTPPFTVAANGFGSDFNANVAGSFAGSAVPEPSGWLMMLAGFGCIGLATRRRTNVQAIAA